MRCAMAPRADRRNTCGSEPTITSRTNSDLSAALSRSGGFWLDGSMALGMVSFLNQQLVTSASAVIRRSPTACAGMRSVTFSAVKPVVSCSSSCQPHAGIVSCPPTSRRDHRDVPTGTGGTGWGQRWLAEGEGHCDSRPRSCGWGTGVGQPSPSLCIRRARGPGKPGSECQLPAEYNPSPPTMVTERTQRLRATSMQLAHLWNRVGRARSVRSADDGDCARAGASAHQWAVGGRRKRRLPPCLQQLHHICCLAAVRSAIPHVQILQQSRHVLQAVWHSHTHTHTSGHTSCVHRAESGHIPAHTIASCPGGGTPAPGRQTQHTAHPRKRQFVNASAGSAQRTPRWRRIAEAFDAVHVVIHDASSAVELVEATSDKRKGW